MQRLIAVAVCAVLLSTGCGYLFDKSAAEAEFDTYLKEMHGDKTILGRTCAGTDSDGDGYVSCEANVRGLLGTEQMVIVECAASFTWASGCKSKVIPLR
ncbi:MAG: hypothetical protein Q7S96_03380 [bacterium]|nr:hypothetical protein [bacterium]